jgi:hypothetical protein
MNRTAYELGQEVGRRNAIAAGEARDVDNDHVGLLLKLEEASLELAAAAHEAAKLAPDAPLPSVNAAHARWVTADKLWKKAVEKCRKRLARKGRR